MKRKSLFLSLLVALMLACQLVTPTPVPSATPTASPSATFAPTTTPFHTATVAKTATVAVTETVSATMLPLNTWESTIKEGQIQRYGADDSATIVCDQDKKTVGVIHHSFRIDIESPDSKTVLRVATYQSEDQLELTRLAWDFCPDATIRFIARPNFTFGRWLSVLPENWSYAKVPNLLLARDDDFLQSPVENPRKVLLTWSIGQVVCAPYQADPGNLPPGVDFKEPQVLQFTVLEDKLDVNLLCGNRKDGLVSVWAYKFSLRDSTDSVELHLLMSDAITWMMSTSADDKSLTVQDFSLGEYTNFARLVFEHNSVGEWISTPLSQFK